MRIADKALAALAALPRLALPTTLAVLVPPVAMARDATGPTVRSPDGAIEVGIGRDEAGSPDWTLRRHGRTIIAPSQIGLEFENYVRQSTGMAITGSEFRAGRDAYSLVAGKTAKVDESYNELTLHFADPQDAAKRFNLVVRAYDTGIAFRYVIPAIPGAPPLRLIGDGAQFRFPADYACTGFNVGHFGSSHEGEFDPVAASRIRPHNLYDLPLVCRTGEAGETFAIAEADIDDWAAMYLSSTGDGTLGVEGKLTRRLDDGAISVLRSRDRAIEGPWRVVMLADSAGKLIENTMLTSLNPAPAGDFSWVKPGKTAWDWWSGPVLKAVVNPGTNTETAKGFIDFASANRLEYMMIDDGWYANSGAGPVLFPGADPTRPIDAINIPGLVKYGKDRDVGIIVWIHWQLLDRNMDTILDQIAKWGIKGIKVDFMDRDDQQMVEFYHRIAAATAKRHLLLDLHGAAHPWGMTRSWPNFITQEGVLGAEYNKWTHRITAQHNVTLAYTRMLLGPMDYTPGGFRNATPETFRPSPVGPWTQTTRGQALAMYVVFESPLQSVADSPDAYAGAAGVDFVAQVPASWDETRFLAGALGKYIVLARRKGTDWYLGAMTDGDARAIEVPLNWLGKGSFAAQVWQDGETPDAVSKASHQLGDGDVLRLNLNGSGGAAAIIRVKKR